ncbi:MAG: hypothetical protein H6557_10070 [Lewinellaceae bacterium]|nr:hypothetical protein [Phaeodactylibacter sp.]MCB9036954.1 hypothetical protein [Lewinellaceae bacterium]
MSKEVGQIYRLPSYNVTHYYPARFFQPALSISTLPLIYRFFIAIWPVLKAEFIFAL